MRVFTFIVLIIFSISLGAIITYACISSGIDWFLAKFYNHNEVYVWVASPFVIAGMGVPFFITGYFYFKWKRRDDQECKTQFFRSLYSFLIAYALMTILKVFTNRVDMEPFEPIGNIDTSNQFRFGFMNSNSWWESFSEGWPSGHTMIAVGMSIAIHSLIKNRLWKSINIIYPLLIAWSVSTAFHWLSDVIAGGIIGIVVGVYYSKQYSADLKPD